MITSLDLNPHRFFLRDFLVKRHQNSGMRWRWVKYDTQPRSKGVTRLDLHLNGRKSSQQKTSWRMNTCHDLIFWSYPFPKKKHPFKLLLSFLQWSILLGLYRAPWKFTNIVVSSFPFIASNGGNPAWPIVATMATISTTRCAVDAGASLVGNWRVFTGGKQQKKNAG